jgi:hypothetical protein
MTRISGFRALALAACAGALAGCSSNLNETGGLRNAIGIAGDAPDEFLVVSKAPLVMPPDMNLRPPRPGATDLGQTDLRGDARAAVTGSANGAGTVAGASPGEQAILARADAGAGASSVREELLREEGIVRKERTLADQVLGSGEGEQTLDPWSEAERLRRETASTTAADAEARAGGQPGSILLEDILGESSTN